MDAYHCRNVWGKKYIGIMFLDDTKNILWLNCGMELCMVGEFRRCLSDEFGGWWEIKI